MPKIIQFIPLLILIFSLNVSNANTFNGFVDLNNVDMQKIQVNGSAEIKNSKFKSLLINGALDFKNLIVSDSIKINGAIEGKNLKCNQLIVDGSLEGYKITVTENTIVNGFLEVLLDNQSKITGQVKGGKISHTKTTA